MKKNLQKAATFTTTQNRSAKLSRVYAANMTDVAAAASAAGAFSAALPAESDPILCPSCSSHFRGTQWPSQADCVPYTLTCCHTLCYACANAAELAQTDENDAVCPICAKKIVPGTKVLNQSMADFSEMVFRENKWDDVPHDDEEEVPRPAPVPRDLSDPANAAAQAKMDELAARCLYGAKKMVEARDRVLAAKKRMQERLQTSIVRFDAQVEELRQKIIAHRDSNIAEAQRLVTERTAILQEQVRDLRAAAEKLRESVTACEEVRAVAVLPHCALYDVCAFPCLQAIRSGDPARMAAAHEAALRISKEAQTDTKPRVSPLVDIVTKTKPVIEAIERLTRVSEGVDASKSPVTGTGTVDFITGDSEEARAHNVIHVVLRDSADMLLDMLVPDDAYVVFSGVPSKTQQQLDECVEISIEKPADGELKITYVMKDPSVKELRLRVDVAAVPIAGSPFTLKASN